VQAGKMSALGQMSAGLAHELNQPLMAIGTYAENAGTFLDRGDAANAATNLARIADLARRMGRIIKNLRAFARQSVEPTSAVDLAAVIEAVLELTAARIADNGVRLDWTPPADPVLAMGGEVRLQQVVMNLVANALDAMQDAPQRCLTIALDPMPDHVRLRIRDTGPGIPDTGRMFDPFFSTKEVGRTEGMGLGLSISYSIVTSFGGTMTGANLAGGGAEFTVDLQPARAEEAA
jgi:two-component system C4-dicarboxylate transport sensor histidine kinase DctB